MPLNKNDVGRQALIQAELSALTMQTVSRVKRGDTLPVDGVYRRMMEMLRKKAEALENTSELTLPLEDVNSWLALALFAEDRKAFLRLCDKAAHQEDEIFQRARPWLDKIIEHDLNSLGTD